MRRTHRLSARSRRWTSLCVGILLILSTLSLIIPVSSKSGFPQSTGITNRNVKKVAPKAPQPGAPSLTLPNLDNARRGRSIEPKAPREIESDTRSRRKPVESRHGRKVGDPLPPKQKASTDSSATDSERAVSDDARVYGMAVRRDHTLTARSVSVVHKTTFAPANFNAEWISTWICKPSCV